MNKRIRKKKEKQRGWKIRIMRGPGNIVHLGMRTLRRSRETRCLIDLRAEAQLEGIDDE